MGKKRNKMLAEGYHITGSTREGCWQFWKNPKGSGNNPEDYAKHIERSAFIHDLFVKNCVGETLSVLELGCNMGRNLNYLFEKGYKNLSGIEISKNAIEYGCKEYPLLAAEIYNNSIENIIRNFAEDEFDVVFTCAVLMHLHVNSDWVFSEIIRIAREFIVIVEDQTTRDYKAIFEAEKFKQIEELHCKNYIPMGEVYVARVFKRK